MPESNTAPTGRLDLDQAVAMITQGDEETSTSMETESPPGDDEVTVEEAAIRQGEGQQPTIDPEEQPESSDDEAEEEEEPEAEEEEDEDSEDQGEESDEEADEETDSEPMFTLSDGTEVTADELKRGYLRQSDYTQKTQQLAEARKQLESVAGQVQQGRQTLAENLNMALSVVEPQLAELSQTNWDQLAASDPYEYAEKRALYDQSQARYNQLVEASQQVLQQQQAVQQQQLQKKLAAEAEALKMALPDMADPDRGRKLRSEITQYAIESAGLSETEAKSITDHRIIVLLHKAAQFDAMKAAADVSRKKVSKTPKKALQAGKPTTKAERTKADQTAKMDRLRRSGKIDDAVELLLG